MATLLLTHSGDFYTIDRVFDAVRALGGDPVRVDTDLFPGEALLASSFDADGVDHVLRAGGREVHARAVRAVWTRKLAAPRLDDDVDEAFRDGCVRESTAALEGFLDGLHRARWVDPPERMRAAENKLRQLRLARDAGLAVPRTLVTNDPRAVREFYRDAGGEVVTKMLTPLTTSMHGADFFVHTSRVAPEDLDDLEGLRLSPMVFQELVPKACELRVVCVGGRFFTGAIDASASERGSVDWRRAQPGEVAWAHHDLADDVREGLVKLMRALGLTYGAIDVIVRPDGRCVFLEVNPSGEWGMLERDLGLPIAQALAEALVEP